MPGKTKPVDLSPLEARVMEILWTRDRVTADDVRSLLAAAC